MWNNSIDEKWSRVFAAKRMYSEDGSANISLEDQKELIEDLAAFNSVPAESILQYIRLAEQYRNLLGEEIRELILTQCQHGWISTRVVEGKTLRHRLSIAREKCVGNYQLESLIDSPSYPTLTDIANCGFKKSQKDSWIGYRDYYSNDVTGELGYYLYATLHTPRVPNDSYKILIHRHYEPDKPIKDTDLHDGESKVVFEGKIQSKLDLEEMLIRVGIR